MPSPPVRRHQRRAPENPTSRCPTRLSCMGSSSRIYSFKKRLCRSDLSHNSLRKITGKIFARNREFSRASRENHVKKQGPLRLVSFATLKTRLLQVGHQPRGVQQGIGGRCPAPSRRARRRAPILVRRSEPASSQVVRIPGLQTKPLGCGTSILTCNLLAFFGRPAGKSSHISCQPWSPRCHARPR
jgi:hypothetical protein